MIAPTVIFYLITIESILLQSIQNFEISSGHFNDVPRKYGSVLYIGVTEYTAVS